MWRSVAGVPIGAWEGFDLRHHPRVEGDLQKLVEACDEVLRLYRARGEASGPAAEQIRAKRRQIEERLRMLESGTKETR